MTRETVTSTEETGPWTPRAKILAAVILAAWAGLAALVGVTGIAASAPGAVFQPIALTAALPVLLFVGAYLASPRFKAFVLAQDIARLTSFQHWRVVGFSFLLLYAAGQLPGVFAFPAGVGDVLIGLAAPLIMARLAADPRFVFSRRFAAYHVLGLVDFAVAVTAASLASGSFPAIHAGPLTSAPMELWPLNLFPSFIVPLFIVLHLSVFLKLAALRRAEGASRRPPPSAAQQPAL